MVSLTLELESEEEKLVSKKPNKLPVDKPLDAEQIAKEKIPASMFEQVAGEKIYDQQIEGDFLKMPTFALKRIKLRWERCGSFFSLF